MIRQLSYRLWYELTQKIKIQENDIKQYLIIYEFFSVTYSLLHEIFLITWSKVRLHVTYEISRFYSKLRKKIIFQ